MLVKPIQSKGKYYVDLDELGCLTKWNRSGEMYKW